MRSGALRPARARAAPARASSSASTDAPTTTAPPPPPSTAPPPPPSSLNGGRGASAPGWEGRPPLDADVDFIRSEAALSDWVDAIGLKDADLDALVLSLAASYDPAALDAGLASRRPQLAARAARVVGAAASFAGALARDAATGALAANTPLRARQARAALVAAGPSFVKVGQILSSRPDLLPKPYLDELASLQDGSEPFSSALARAVIEQELGRRVGDVFSELSAEPVAAASLGQVYKGVLAATGAAVAVKVQRPGVAATLAMDMALLRKVAAAVDARAPALAALADGVIAQPLAPLVDEFAARLFGELDYVAEGRAAEKFEALYGGPGTRVKVPGIVWEASARRVLTLEWVDGVKLTDGPALAEAGLDVVDLVKVGIECTLRQLLEHGYFHADPHPGNLLATRAGDLVWLDFGMMSEAPPSARTAIIAHVAHLVARDFDAMTRDYYALGFVDRSVDTSPIAPYLAAFFGDVLETPVDKLNFRSIVDGLGGVLFQFPFRAPAYYVLILRSLTVLEGLALNVDPTFKLLGSAWPYMARRLLTDRDAGLRDALAGLVLEKGGAGGAGAAAPPRLKWDAVDSLLAAGAESADGIDGADLAALARWALGAEEDGGEEAVGAGGDGTSALATTAAAPAPARLRAAAAAEAARALDAAVAERVRAALRARAGDAVADRVAPALPGDAAAAARARALAAAAGPHLPPSLAAVIGVARDGEEAPPPLDASFATLSTAARDAAAAVADALATPAGREAAAALASELAARFAARTVKAVFGPGAPAPRRRVSAFETGGRDVR